MRKICKQCEDKIPFEERKTSIVAYGCSKCEMHTNRILRAYFVLIDRDNAKKKDLIKKREERELDGEASSKAVVAISKSKMERFTSPTNAGFQTGLRKQGIKYACDILGGYYRGYNWYYEDEYKSFMKHKKREHKKLASR